MARLVIGVDGGNSKTVALVADLDGHILGAGRGGPSDIYSAPSADHALDAVTQSIGGALREAGASIEDVGAAVLSAAGADWPEDFLELEGGLAGRLGPLPSVRVVNDAIGALWAATEDGVGVAVVAGTGDAVGARAPDGRVWHSSFWMQPTGGASQLGQRGMHAVLAAELGTGPSTSLRARALALFGEPDVESLLHAMTRRADRLSWRTVARLAPAVFDCAAAGDAAALALVQEQGRRLGSHARVAAKRVGLASGYPICLMGGVFRHPTALLSDVVLNEVPDARPVRPLLEPVCGAVVVATHELGRHANHANLVATLPSAEFFATAEVFRWPPRPAPGGG